MGGILDTIGSEMIGQIGKAGANALFPNDFEYYAVTLELTSFDGQTIEYLTFPVTPNAISYDDVKVTNIKKSFAGVTALDTDSFIPKRLSLSGTFGRKLRVLVGGGSFTNPASTANGVFDNIRDNGLTIRTSILDAKLKTGYGTTKILEAISTKSSGVDNQNRPNKLFLYIPPLGHNFLVKINQLKLSQDYSNNMMWQYEMQLTALAKVEDLDSGNAITSLLKSTGMDLLQRGIDSSVGSITSSIF